MAGEEGVWNVKWADEEEDVGGQAPQDVEKHVCNPWGDDNWNGNIWNEKWLTLGPLVSARIGTMEALNNRNNE